MKHFQLTTLSKASVSAFAITAFLATNSAYAQSSDEIIVTARKQETTLQDTPLAITTFNTEAIKDAGFQDIIDISKAAPGLFIETISDRNARIDTSPRFRGITVDNTSPLLRTASVFIDGVYVTGGLQGLGTSEVERVEIIKGPQSALFGRNTFAGAINYVTKRPNAEFGGEVSALAATALSICETSKQSAKITKQMFMAIADGQSGETEQTEKWFLDAFGSADFKEGYQAFLEKRKPQF